MTEKDLESFKAKLIETTTFPTVYMFKFIVEADNRKIALVENLFDEEAEILTKQSANGKYISITSKQVAVSVEEILEVYKKAAEIKGIMFL
jgi:putative lipoic acid-binding regulatory protein